MTRLVLGVIGHVDHGKTALVRALTGQDTDRLAEEKQRGISIALGFAHLEAGPDTAIDLIDMPGHERFVRTMIAGATGIDAVLLVVAADEGVKPQTIEHVQIAGLLGLKRAVVAISKTDRVAPEQARAVAAEAAGLLARTGLQAQPAVMTSAREKTGLDELTRALGALTASRRPRIAKGLLFLPVDRAFSLPGHGPVVTGTLRGAAVNTDDILELWPSRRRIRVRAIQVHGTRVRSAMPGQRVALNLRDIEITELARGMALAAPDTLAPSEWLTIAIRAVDGAPPLANGARVRAMLGTAEVDARLRLLDRDVLGTGEAGFAQVHCAQPIALPAGESVVLRLPSPPRTVAGGRVLEPVTRRQRRRHPPLLERLEALRTLAPAALIAAEIDRAGLTGAPLSHLSRLTAISMPALVELLGTLPVVVTRSGWVAHKACVEELLARIPPLLAREKTALSRDQLLSLLGRAGAEILEEALRLLLSRGVISDRGGRLSIPRPDADRARARAELQLASRIAERLRQAGLSPPSPEQIVTDASSKRAVDRLMSEGLVVRAVDRAKERDILFHRDAIEEAKRRLAPLLARPPGLLVTEIGAALGISRKYSLPLLNYLDTTRFTRRVDKDRRMHAGATTRGPPQDEAAQEHL